MIGWAWEGWRKVVQNMYLYEGEVWELNQYICICSFLVQLRGCRVRYGGGGH